jgi:hypothetical protein
MTSPIYPGRASRVKTKFMVVMKLFVEIHFRENHWRKLRKIAQISKTNSTILAATFAKILAETAAKY